MSKNGIERHFMLSFLLALSIWLAAFGNAVRKDGRDYGAFDPFTEALIAYGRPLSIITISTVILIFFASGQRFRKFGVFKFGGILLCVQIFFIVKIFYAGALAFSVQALITYLIIFFGLYLYPFSRSGDIAFHSSILVYFGLLFAAINVYVYWLHPVPSQTDFGRFFGVMQNPQHFAISAMLPLPAMVFGFASNNSSALKRVLLAIATIALGFLIYRTGSRMGVLSLLLLCGLLAVFYRRKLGNFLFAALFLFAYLATTELLSLAQFDALDRFVDGRTNTRSFVWEREFSDFLSHPLFGVPPNEDLRLEFAENLWLSWASNGGIIVSFLGMLLLFQILNFIYVFGVKKSKTGARDSQSSEKIVVISLSIILFQSLFESVFAGILSSMTMLTFVVMSMAVSVQKNAAGFGSRRAVSRTLQSGRRLRSGTTR